jgi:hypothetical protein
MDGLESLLKSRESRTFFIEPKPPGEPTQTQQSDKGASLFDLVTMISKMISVTMKDINVEFVPDEGKQVVTDPSQHLDHPYITYKVVSREPKKELKARVREEISENVYDKNSKRTGDVYGQKFECILQFNVFASEYNTAETVMERFEDMMLTYTGHFKKNGVGELLFKKQYTDENYNQFRQMISIRNLQYYVEIEKLTVIFKENIQAIETYK